VSAAVYEMFVTEFTRGRVDWENDQFKVMLVTNEYRPDQWADGDALAARRFEVPPSGTYRRGGADLGARSVDGGFPEPVKLTGGEVGWGGFTGMFRYAVVYRSSDDLLVGYTDLGAQNLVGADVTLSYGDDAAICEFLITPGD
jgi:hypothetical protein